MPTCLCSRVAISPQSGGLNVWGVGGGGRWEVGAGGLSLPASSVEHMPGTISATGE